MSSSDAQRSPVHQSTEDSGVEPSGATAPPADLRRGPDDAARADSPSQPGQEPGREDRTSTDPDESSFGGPLKLDDPNAV